MAELERMQAQLQKERTRMYNLRKRAREAENKVQRQAAAVMRQKELVQTTEKQRKNILRPDGFKEKVRRTTIQRQKYLRGLERKNTRAGSPSEKKSLCNICSVCTCSWMLCGEPVEGWVAEPSKLYKDGWVVLRCPEAKL